MRYFQRSLHPTACSRSSSSFNPEALHQDVRVPSYHEIWAFKEGDQEAAARDWVKLMGAVYGAEEDSDETLRTLFPEFASHNSSEGNSKATQVPDLEYFRERFQSRSEFDPQGMFFITHRSSLVGSVIAMVSEQEGAKICWLAVHPKHRRQGVGTALMDLCVNYLAKKRAQTQVMVEIEDNSEGAVQFLRAHDTGFEDKTAS